MQHKIKHTKDFPADVTVTLDEFADWKIPEDEIAVLQCSRFSVTGNKLLTMFFLCCVYFFRPVAMTFGPDGALYFADFYSTLFENMWHPKRAEGRDHIRGRIWRVTYEDRPLLEAPQIVGEPIPELLDLLKA